MFQDRGELFSLQDGHPNIYAPGKRPFQTIIPGFAARKASRGCAFGVMGGDMQPQGQTQIILNRVDYGLDVQAAADSPRWHHEGSSQSMGEDAAGLGAARPAPSGSRRSAGDAQSAHRRLAGRWARATADSAATNASSIHTSRATDRVYAAGSEMRCDAVALAY